MASILTEVLHRRGLTDATFGLAVGVRSQQINRIKHGKGRASPDLARRIEAALDGAVKRGDLRPDLWPDDRAAETGSLSAEASG